VKLERMLGYAIVGGIGLAVAYKIFIEQSTTPNIIVGTAGVNNNRNIMNPTNPNYPTAGWAEAYGPENYNKSTAYSPVTTYTTPQSAVSYGSVVFID